MKKKELIIKKRLCIAAALLMLSGTGTVYADTAASLPKEHMQA